jgi:hypothetical protein
MATPEDVIRRYVAATSAATETQQQPSRPMTSPAEAAAAA